MTNLQNQNLSRLKLDKKIVGFFSLSLLLSANLFLVSCSSDDDNDTSSGEAASSTPPSNNDNNQDANSNTESNTESNSDSDRDPNLNEPAAADNCVLQNVVLNPPSGSTLTNGDVLKVTLDYRLQNDVSERIYFYGYLRSVDNDDYFDDWEKASFTGPGKAGRYINHFTFRIDTVGWSNDTDNYTTLVLRHGPDSGCDEAYPVNYNIIVD